MKAQTNKHTNNPGIEVCSCLNIIISINMISGTSSNNTRTRTDKNQRRARGEGEAGEEEEEGFSRFLIFKRETVPRSMTAEVWSNCCLDWGAVNWSDTSETCRGFTRSDLQDWANLSTASRTNNSFYNQLCNEAEATEEKSAQEQSGRCL